MLARPLESSDSPTSDGLERLCVSLEADLDLAGVTVVLMVRDGSQALAAASRAAVTTADAVQFDVGEGPSRDAFTLGRPVLVPDLDATDGRWPGFVPAARAHDIAAVHAFPLQEGAVRLGVLTCYSDAVRSLTPHELSRCTTYAEVATRFIVEQEVDAAPGPGGFLDKDLQIRTEVYQAQGMVMVDLQIGLAEAMVRMRAAAFAAGISLNQLAIDLVAGDLSLTGEETDT